MGDGGSWEQDTYGLDRLTPIPWCIAAAAMMAAFATEELGSNKGEPPISRVQLDGRHGCAAVMQVQP